jgi:hypothetical protein
MNNPLYHHQIQFLCQVSYTRRHVMHPSDFLELLVCKHLPGNLEQPDNKGHI